MALMVRLPKIPRVHTESAFHILQSSFREDNSVCSYGIYLERLISIYSIDAQADEQKSTCLVSLLDDEGENLGMP